MIQGKSPRRDGSRKPVLQFENIARIWRAVNFFSRGWVSVSEYAVGIARFSIDASIAHMDRGLSGPGGWRQASPTSIHAPLFRHSRERTCEGLPLSRDRRYPRSRARSAFTGKHQRRPGALRGNAAGMRAESPRSREVCALRAHAGEDAGAPRISSHARRRESRPGGATPRHYD